MTRPGWGHAGRVWLATVGVLAAAIALVPESGAEAEVAACRPAEPSTCTLGELADLVGLRLGSVIEEHQLDGGSHADILASEFNALTPENRMKWFATQPSRDVWTLEGADAVVDFATTNGLEVRGHTLVWSQDTNTPAWVLAISDPADMRSVVAERISRLMGRYRGRVQRWDVVNEPLDRFDPGPSDSVFARTLGDDWIAEVFALAEAADPEAELWLNETLTDYVPAKHDALVVLVRELVDAGVPIDGVGIQTIRYTTVGPEADEYERQLQDFADLGVDVAITELEVATDPADAAAFTKQAATYERIVGACLRVTRCVEVTIWGISDSYTWLDSDFFDWLPHPSRPLLWDDNYQPKLAYAAVRDLLAEAALAEEVPPMSTPDPPPTTSGPESAGPTSPVPAPTAATPAEPINTTPSFTG